MANGFKFKVTQDFDPKKIDALKQTLARNRRVVQVGLPDSAKEADGTSLAMIGAVHEFGSPAHGIPERSWLRSSLTESRDKFVALNKRNLVRIMEGQMSVDQALSQLGAFAAGQAQKKIASGPFAELLARTIKRKGSSKPLNDTGNMRQSVTFEVGDKADD